MPTVKEFLTRAYRLISANSPTVPLHGSDMSDGLSILNSLLDQYAATSLLLPIATTETLAITAGTSEIVCGPSDFVPTPDITTGRLSYVESAWLELDGTTYPLIEIDENVFLQSYRYDPLMGLPRFMMTFFETQVTRLRIYPAAAQTYNFNLRGKFQKTPLASNGNLDGLPDYYIQFFYYAVAREIAFFKGREEAWTPKLEAMYAEKRDIIESTSELDLSLDKQREPLLNGANRVRAGI